MKIYALILLLALGLSGCKSYQKKGMLASPSVPQAEAAVSPPFAAGAPIKGAPSQETATPGAPSEPSAAARASRMLVWTSTLEIKVNSTTESLAKAVALTAACGGYAESQTIGHNVSSAVLRIPTMRFNSSIDALEKLGELLNRAVEGKDVTDQYVDLDSRIKTMTELRDRMRLLLTQTKEIKEILAIETELNRIQSDLDSMQARLKVLSQLVEFSTINLTFRTEPIAPPERMTIYGPVGYAVKGIGWVLEKMWVIRE